MTQHTYKSYDKNNIFAKILKGNIACQKVYEDTHALAFHDLHPKAPIHVLVIPKGEYTCFDDFINFGSDAEIMGFFKAVQKVSGLLGISEPGWRLIANSGSDGGQEVPHFHVHLLGGKSLGGI